MMWYATFSGEGVAMQMPGEKGKHVTGKYYKDVVLEKLKKKTDTAPSHVFQTCPTSTW